LNGEAFWVLSQRLRVNGAPTLIEPVMPGLMYPRIDDYGNLLKYTYRLPGRQVDIPPEDVVHFKLPSPENWWRGQSPVQAIRYALDTHKESDIFNAKRLENNGVPAGIVTTKTSLTPEQVKKYRDQWRGMYGGVENGGKVAFLPEGMAFTEVQQSNAEMQYVEGKQSNRDDILAAYGVGLEILGKTESQTRANAEAAIYVFKQFGVLPFTELFADTLTNDYLTTFPGTAGMEFSYPDPVPENMEEKRQNAQTLFSIGALTPNEARKTFGMEPISEEAMDTPYTPISSIPLGSTGIEPNVPIEPNTSENTSGTQNVEITQDAVLNGAQVTAATAIVAGVAAGEIPRDSGIGQLMVLFNLTEEQAEQIMGSAGTDTPTTPNPRPQEAETVTVPA
jgi:HK97 family phage portal protein